MNENFPQLYVDTKSQAQDAQRYEKKKKKDPASRHIFLKLNKIKRK